MRFHLQKKTTQSVQLEAPGLLEYRAVNDNHRNVPDELLNGLYFSVSTSISKHNITLENFLIK